jgi:hypothetical protein
MHILRRKEIRFVKENIHLSFLRSEGGECKKREGEDIVLSD